MTPKIVNKPTIGGSWEYYFLVHEFTDFNGFVNPFEISYRVGPYPSYEEAMDMFYIAYYTVKPEFDEIGREIYWNMEIEEKELEIPYGKYPDCKLPGC